MKNYFYYLLFLGAFIIALNTVKAQSTYEISYIDSGIVFSVACPCYKVTVQNAQQEQMKNTAEDWLRHNSFFRVEDQGNYLTIKEVRFKLLPTDTLLTTYNFIPENNGAAAIFSFTGKAEKINASQQVKHINLQKELDLYANKVLVVVLENEVSTLESNLSGLEKDLKKARKEIKKSEKSVASAQVEIDELKQKISVLENDEKLTTEKISNSKSKIYSLKGEEKKAAESQLKIEEKERDNLYKQKEKIYEQIVDDEAEIREQNFSLNEKRATISSLETKILEVKASLTNTKEKLKTIENSLK